MTHKKRAAQGGPDRTPRSRRLPVLPPRTRSRAQVRFVKEILKGARGGSDQSPRAMEKILAGGPFNAWMRSPELGDLLQRVGEYVRFRSSLPQRISEFAILITARHWTAQYEWYFHLPLAVEAGLKASVADALAAGRRPRGMAPDEAAVYAFCTELYRETRVRNAAFKRIVDLFGERGLIDLVGLCGYYTAVSMTLNVAETPLPAGVPLPLEKRRSGRPSTGSARAK